MKAPTPQSEQDTAALLDPTQKASLTAADGAQAAAIGQIGALMMLWVYYAAMILFAGAVVTATIDERLGSLPKNR